MFSYLKNCGIPSNFFKLYQKFISTRNFAKKYPPFSIQKVLLNSAENIPQKNFAFRLLGTAKKYALLIFFSPIKNKAKIVNLEDKYNLFQILNRIRDQRKILKRKI